MTAAHCSIARFSIISYIGLGSNLNNPKQQLKNALFNLQNTPKIQLINTSSFYQNPPLGPQDQPDYVNAVAQISTDLSALLLLDTLQSIEQQQGRQRASEQWGPRTLDLDILLYNNSIIHHPRLTIPHTGLKSRAFVLQPLQEISPYLTLPNGTSITELVKKTDSHHLQKI